MGGLHDGSIDKIHTISTSPATYTDSVSDHQSIEELPDNHDTSNEDQQHNNESISDDTCQNPVDVNEDSVMTVSQKLSERLKAYGASSWMCKRVKLGNVTLVPGVGGVAVIPELDLTVRQRNRLRAARRPIHSPLTSLLQGDTMNMKSAITTTSPHNNIVNEEECSPSQANIAIEEKNVNESITTTTADESSTLKLIAKLERQSRQNFEYDDDEYNSDEGHSDEENADGHADHLEDDAIDIDIDDSSGRGNHFPNVTNLSDFQFNNTIEPHSMEASAPWYSKHRRSMHVRDEVRRDIAKMLEKNAIVQNKLHPVRTISREKLNELSKPRRHEDPASATTKQQLIVQGTVDRTCRSRSKEQKIRKAKFQLKKLPEKAEVKHWRLEKQKREEERVEKEQREKEEEIRRSKTLHGYLSKNASQNLSSYIEIRKKQLEKAKEKRELSDGTFNTLKGGGSCWDLNTLRQQGIRVIR